VLEAIRAAGPLSRVQVSELTGLTSMSVHRRVAELKRRKLITAAGSSPAGAVGRPSSLFRFNGSIGHVVGLDVGNETTRAVLVDLDRNRLAARELPTASIETDLAGHLEDLVRGLLAEARVRPDSLMAVAGGIAGVTRPDGTIARASQHHAWDGLRLGAMLRSTLGVEVDLRQDDHLATLAEVRVGALAGARTGLLVNVGKGVGFGIVSGGEVYAGAHGAAGRATWIPMSPAGGGERGLAGDLVTGDALVGAYRAAGGSRPVEGAREVFAADTEGDPAAAAAIEQFTARLAWLIATAIAIVDPELVVLGGGVGRAYGRLHEELAAEIAAIIPSPPPLVASSLGPGAVISGATDAALAIADATLRERLGA
jgi:predicted NBD/HSP70 family sugar kinase